jgi:hypothetical protein
MLLAVLRIRDPCLAGAPAGRSSLLDYLSPTSWTAASNRDPVSILEENCDTTTRPFSPSGSMI